MVHYGLWLFDRLFEYILYPTAIIQLGLVCGTGLMMFVSFLVCWGLLVLYDWVSSHWVRDALGFETLKEVMGRAEILFLNPKFPKVLIRPAKYIMYVGPGMLILVLWGALMLCLSVLLYPLRIILYTLRRFVIKPAWLWLPWLRSVLLFFYLSLVFDPMTCVVLLRPQGKHRMDVGDWIIFLLSVLISNIVWGLMVWTGVETLEALMPGIWEKAAALLQSIVGRS